MKRVMVVLLGVGLMWTAGLAAEGGETPPAAEKPAATVAAKVIPDHCQDAVDPYNSGGERTRFLAAAGPDNELSAEEAETNRKAEQPFVRKFDAWKAMAAFDKNSNGTLDWFEADAYRKALRDRMLSAFDADKNGSLKDKEREAANQALEAGKIPTGRQGAEEASVIWVPAPTAPKAEGGRGGAPAPSGAESRPAGDAGEMLDGFRRQMMEKYDANKDGELDETEREAMRQAFQERMGEWRRQAELRRYDKDGDGQLSQQEQAERDKEMEQWKARAQGARANWMGRWDKDGDGQLSPEEQAAMQDGIRQGLTGLISQATNVSAKVIAQYDKDGDGKLSPEEAQPLREGAEAQLNGIRKEMDADGDGKISEEEGRAFRDKIMKDYDADGDGQLNDEERAKLMKDAVKRVLNVDPDE